MKERNFEAYYQKYERMIHYFLHDYNIHYHYDDYFQLMCIKLWELYNSYDCTMSDNEEKYIYIKLKYYLIDLLRKFTKESMRLIPTQEQSILDKSYYDHYKIEMYTLLSILTDNELTWFKLTLQGFSTQEIAIYMNKSNSTIKGYRKHTRRKLKQYFLF